MECSDLCPYNNNFKATCNIKQSIPIEVLNSIELLYIVNNEGIDYYIGKLANHEILIKYTSYSSDEVFNHEVCSISTPKVLGYWMCNDIQGIIIMEYIPDVFPKIQKFNINSNLGFTMNTCNISEYTQILQKIIFENELKFSRNDFGNKEYNMDKINTYINGNENIQEEDLYQDYSDEDNYERYYPYEIFLTNSGKYKFYDLSDYKQRLFIYWICSTFIITLFEESKVFNDDIEVINFLYNNLPVNNISEFIIYSNFIRHLIIGAHHTVDFKIKWLLFFCRVYYDNPNIFNSDMELAFFNCRDISIYDDRLKCLKNEIKIINDNKISVLWKFWELNQEEYDNFIQWLPEEMIVDISELEKKPGERFSYSTH